MFGTPGGILTHDQWLMRPLLWDTKLPAQVLYYTGDLVTCQVLRARSGAVDCVRFLRLLVAGASLFICVNSTITSPISK